MALLLLLLLLEGFWAQVVSPQELQNATMAATLTSALHTKVPSTSEALIINSTGSTGPVTVGPKETTSIWRPTPTPPSSSSLATNEFSSFGIPIGDNVTTPVRETTTFQEVSSKTSVLFPEPSDVSSDPPITTANPVTLTSLETVKGTSARPVTMTTSSTETGGPSVATTVSSKTSGPPVTMATGSLWPSNETHGNSATMTTRSVESSSVAGGTPVSGVKTSMTPSSKPEPIATRTPQQGSSGMFLVPMLVALVVVVALVALLLLWRRRQKRRTGALILSRGGKRNGVVDAWAGPAHVSDEEATAATASGPGGSKGSGAVETERSGQRPTLTTFFSRRKSRQGSVVMEELKPSPDPNLKGEEEPLVGSEDDAVETPTSDGLQAKDGAAPQCL
ncbi:leukosialin isoform X2 [Acomys russatus]|nr:leukosialin isoform X2 [Acomys russatus]XP_051002955.1 leukosialin isoform X2 [Acomys russatus]